MRRSSPVPEGSCMNCRPPVLLPAGLLRRGCAAVLAIALWVPAAAQPAAAAMSLDDITSALDKINRDKFDYVVGKRRRDPFTFRKWQPRKTEMLSEPVAIPG